MYRERVFVAVVLLLIAVGLIFLGIRMQRRAAGGAWFLAPWAGAVFLGVWAVNLLSA